MGQEKLWCQGPGVLGERSWLVMETHCDISQATGAHHMCCCIAWLIRAGHVQLPGLDLHEVCMAKMCKEGNGDGIFAFSLGTACSCAVGVT